MLARRIIPCLDVTGGRVVKGINFVGLRDAGDPVEVARRYDAEGADELTFLDITATSDGRPILLDVVRRTAEQVFIPLTVGGGVRKLEDIRALLSAGADKVSINSAAVADPAFVRAAARRFGSQCTVVAIDAKRVTSHESRVASPKSKDPGLGPRDSRLETGVPALRVAAGPERSEWEVYTHGGRRATGIDVVGWARRVSELGAGEILLTSMDADGTTSGYDLALTRAVADAVSVPVIASGGAGGAEHLYEALTTGGADAALAASIFHYGQTTVAAVRQYLRQRGVPVRE